MLLGTHELGGPECPWPIADSREPELLRVLRGPGGALLERAGDLTTCSVLPGPVGVGLRGGDSDETVISELRVRRSIIAE